MYNNYAQEIERLRRKADREAAESARESERMRTNREERGRSQKKPTPRNADSKSVAPFKSGFCEKRGGVKEGKENKSSRSRGRKARSLRRLVNAQPTCRHNNH